MKPTGSVRPSYVRAPRDANSLETERLSGQWRSAGASADRVIGSLSLVIAKDRANDRPVGVHAHDKGRVGVHKVRGKVERA